MSSEEDFILAAYQKTRTKYKKSKKDYCKSIKDKQLYGDHRVTDIKKINGAADAEFLDYEDNAPPQFQLENNDEYHDLCGKAFITKNRILVLHCLYCGRKYGALDFLKHLTMHHYKEEINPVNEDRLVFSNVHIRHTNEICIKSELNEIGLRDESEKSEEDNSIWDEFHVDKNLNKNKSCLDTFFSKKWKRKPDSYKCNQCEKQFRTKSGLSNHIERHSEIRKYKCPICDIPFKEKSNCNAHIRRHTEEKKYKCIECSKSFFTRTEIERHLRTHTGERPFICSTCGKNFSVSAELKRHMMRHENIRPYKCTFCEKSFFAGHTLKNHIRVHSNERPFQCSICSTNFKSRKTLRQHNKLHINARSYKCKLCDKAFNQKPALISHMKTHKVL